MDVPGLGQERYQNFDELYTYCYRVAGNLLNMMQYNVKKLIG